MNGWWPLALLALVTPLPAASALAHVSGGPAARAAALTGWWLVLAPLPALVLGWCGCLDPLPLLAAHAVLLGAGLAAGRPALANARALHDGMRQAAADPAVRALLLAAAALLTALPVALAVLPCSDWDTHMYQLPAAAEFWRAGSVDGRPEQWLAADDFMRGVLYYPGSWTVLLAQGLGLGRSTWAALIANLGALAAFAAASAWLARLAGASPRAAAAAALAALALPLAQENVHSAHVDLPFAAAVVVSLAAALAAGRSACPRWTALALAAAGAALGFKTSGVWCAPLCLAVLLAACGRRTLALRPAGVLAGFALAALLAAPWYLRTWFETGNPIGVVAVPALGWPGVIDAAFVRATTLASVFDPLRLRHWELLLGALACYAWPVLAGLGAALWLRRTPATGGRERLLLTVIAAALAWLHWHGPWSGKHAWEGDLDWWLAQQLRYSLALWAVLAALAAAWSGRGTVLAGAALLAVMAAPWWWPWWWMAAAPAALLLGLLGLGAVLRPRWLAPLALALLLALPPLLHGWSARLRDQVFNLGSGVGALAALPAGEPVAVAASHQSWLAYGDDGRRPVRWLDLSRCRDDRQRLQAVARLDCAWLVLGETWPSTSTGLALLLAAHPEVAELTHGQPGQWGMTLWRLRQKNEQPPGQPPSPP
ncbi:MAG: hypothetical protein L6R48_14600 [Planctomycetes bacterium]|nr:hypothetical protein [Planctomycetota bacterium]